VTFSVNKSSPQITSVIKKNCPKKTIAQEAKIRPIWSPWCDCFSFWLYVLLLSYKVASESKEIFEMQLFRRLVDGAF
jgi:hypothetical protein